MAGFADVVRRVIGERSQRDIADKVGVSQTTIHNMMQGRVPSRSTLQQFADRLELPPDAVDDLLIAAGYREWDPEMYFWGKFAALKRKYDVREDPAEILNWTDVDVWKGLEGKTREEVDGLLTRAEGSLRFIAERVVPAGKGELPPLTEDDHREVRRNLSYGWGDAPVRPEFALAIQSVVGDMSDARIAQVASLNIRYVPDLLRGYVPSLATLLRIAGRLDLSPRDASMLCQAAGYGGWTPRFAFTAQFQELIPRIVDAHQSLTVRFPSEAELSAMTPGQILRFLGMIENAANDPFRDEDEEVRPPALSHENAFQMGSGGYLRTLVETTAKRTVEHALERTGITPESGESRFWRLYAQARASLDFDGIHLLSPDYLPLAINWERLTQEQAEELIARLERLSREFADENGMPSTIAPDSDDFFGDPEAAAKVRDTEAYHA